MYNDPIQWNLDRAWEHLTAAFKEAQKFGTPQEFTDSLEETMVQFSGTKGLYLDLANIPGHECKCTPEAGPTEEPFIAIGNDELKDNPVVYAGMRIRCPHCNEPHELRGGKTDKGIETEILLFYKCPKEGNSYLAAIDNKLVGRFELEVVS